MLKNLRKKLSIGLMCLSILATSSVPAFAATNKNTKDPTTVTIDGSKYTIPELINKFGTGDKTRTLTTQTTGSTTLVDGQTDYQSVAQGNQVLYVITVPDENIRTITINGSSSPVKSTLRAAGMDQFISFDSGASRNGNLISTVMLPGMTYYLTITPQNATSLTVSMSLGGNNESWVNCGNDGNNTNTSWTEKNILLGQNTDGYDIQFQNPGTYSVTVENKNPSVTLTLLGSNYSTVVIPIPATTYTFPTNIKVTAAEAGQLNYRLLLKNNGAAHNGSPYTVTIKKVN